MRKRETLKTKTTGLLNFTDYKNAGPKIAYGFMIAFLVIFSLIALTPILWLIVTSFKTVSEINASEYHLFPEVWDFNKIVTLWNKIKFGRYYVNTFIVVILSMISAVVFNGLLAYAIAIIKPIGHKVINVLILLGYMIPSALAITPLFVSIKNLGLTNSYLPLFLTFGANAYYYMLFKDYFSKLPKSLFEAAEIDGGGYLQIFFRVIIPLSKPMIGVVAIFAMTASYSDFLLPYLVLQKTDLQTVMVGVYRLSGTTTLDASEKLLLITLSIIPQIILFLIFQKQIMGTQVNSGMKD